MPSMEYKEELDRAWDLHVRKNAGYAGADNPDPWANFRMCEAFGITAFQGCMVRMSDKYIRVTNLMRDASNDQVGESIIDTLRDLAAYALIGVVLLQEPDREDARRAVENVNRGLWTAQYAMTQLGLGEELDKVIANFDQPPVPQEQEYEDRIVKPEHIEEVIDWFKAGHGHPVPEQWLLNCGLPIAGDLFCLRKQGHRGYCYHP